MRQHLDSIDANLSGETTGVSDFGVLAAIWRRKSIVACVFVIAVGLGYLKYLRSPSVFQSSAQVLLIKKEVIPIVAGPEGQLSYEDTLSTHMLLLKSPLIVKRAVAKYDLASLPSLQNVGDPVSMIVSGLKAARDGDRYWPDPNVMRLSYESTQAQDCPTILGAVIDSYQDFLGETYQNAGEETVKLIRQAKDVLHRQLSEKESSYRKFREEAPLPWKGSDVAQIHEARMEAIEQDRSKVIVQNSQIKSQLVAIQSAMKNQDGRVALRLLIDKRTLEYQSKTSAGPVERQLFEAMLKLQLLLGDFGPDHPEVKRTRKKISLLTEHLGGSFLKGQRKLGSFAELYVESLRQELKVGEQRIKGLNDIFDEEQKAAKAMSYYQTADETYRNDIARTQKLFESVLKHLEEITLVKDHSGVMTQLISPPSKASQIQPKFLISMMVSVVLGLLLGIGLGYVVDVSDRRFRSPDEICSELGLPIVGHIPVIEINKKALTSADQGLDEHVLDFSLCTYHEPKGVPAEAYRAVRTSLYFSTRGENHKIIQVTSPDPADGKTTLASNLAISIADSGRKILLIEADFRRPRFRKLFSIDAKIGLSSIIAGEAELSEGIHQTIVENLSVMHCGIKPHNPSELLTSPHFQQLLESLREKYELIILDTPPLLSVTDPSVVASRVDGVLLVLRLTKHARDNAIRATEMLNTLGAKVLGIVVNSVDKSTWTGYGKYRFGYSTGYGYNYYYGNAESEELKNHHGEEHLIDSV